MSQQHRKWIELVKERIEQRGWSQTDLAIVVGVSPSAITQLVKDGKGSDDLKLRINKKLRINESWEKFEEQKIQMKTATVKMFKERPNGDLSEFIIELTIPSRRRYGAVIREYIEYYNAKHFAKIYFYEVLELETSKNQRGVNYERN